MKKIIVCLLFFCMCGPLWINYDIMYFDGEKKTMEFAKKLEKENKKYKVIKHIENIYEVQYKETSK